MEGVGTLANEEDKDIEATTAVDEDLLESATEGETEQAGDEHREMGTSLSGEQAVPEGDLGQTGGHDLLAEEAASEVKG